MRLLVQNGGKVHPGKKNFVTRELFSRIASFLACHSFKYLMIQNILADYLTVVDFGLLDQGQKRMVELHQAMVVKRNLPTQVPALPPLILLLATAQNLTHYQMIQTPTLKHPIFRISTTILSEVRVVPMGLTQKGIESVTVSEVLVEEA